MMTEIGPFSILEYEQRLSRLQEQIALQHLNGLVAFSSYQEREGHVAYLTNHRNSFPNVMTHLGLGHAAVVVPVEGKSILVAPGGYQMQKVTGISDACTGYALIPETERALKMLNLKTGKLGLAGLDVIPAEYYLHLQKTLPKVTFEKADDILENMRLIKSQAEIEVLRKAARVADAGLKAGLEAINPGVSGLEIEKITRSAAMDAGADFIPRVRVCSGKNVNPLIWPQVDRRKLEEGDFVFLDLIGWHAGYGFDCSRVAVAGDATQEKRDYLEQLAEATEWMISRLKPGIARTFYLAESRGREIHPSGHSIGLEICEAPWIEMSRPIKLKPGMVLCIEPMLVSPRFGKMAVEDMVAITDDGAEVLNQLARLY